MVFIRRIAISLLAFCLALLVLDIALIALSASTWALHSAGLLLTVPTVAYVLSSANGRVRRTPKRPGRGRLPGATR